MKEFYVDYIGQIPTLYSTGKLTPHGSLDSSRTSTMKCFYNFCQEGPS